MSGRQDPLMKYIHIREAENDDQACKDLARSAKGLLTINGDDLLDINLNGKAFKEARKPITNARGESTKHDTMVKRLLPSLVSTIYNSLDLTAFPAATEERFYDFFSKHFHQGGFLNCAGATLTEAAVLADFAYIPNATTGSETGTLEAVGNKLISTSIIHQPSTALHSLTDIEHSPFDAKPTMMTIAITHEISWNEPEQKWGYDLVVVNHDSATACLIQGKLYQNLNSAVDQYKKDNPEYIDKQSYIAGHSLISNPLGIVSPGQAVAFILGQSGNRTTETSLRILFLKELAKNDLLTLPEGGIKDEKDVIAALKSFVATYAGDNPKHGDLIEACANKLERVFTAGNFLPQDHHDLVSSIKEIDNLLPLSSITPKASASAAEADPVSFASSVSARTTSFNSPAGSHTFFPPAPEAPKAPAEPHAGAGQAPGS